MNRFLSLILPHPKGEYRAPVIHKPALTIYILLLAAVYLFLHFYKTSVPGILGFASDIFSEDIVTKTNSYRQQYHLSLLHEDPELSLAAKEKAEDMFAKDYWAHVAPDGVKPWDFINSSGYSYVYAGENLAKDFQKSEAIVAAWMESPTHRQNILNDNFRDIGVAVVNGTLDGYETTLVVQLFGQRAGQFMAGSPTPPVEKTPIAAFARTTGVGGRFQTQPKVNIFSLTRGLSLALGSIVLGFFTFDAFVARRRGIVRLSGHTLAHFGLLLLLLVVAWFLTPGAVL